VSVVCRALMSSTLTPIGARRPRGCASGTGTGGARLPMWPTAGSAVLAAAEVADGIGRAVKTQPRALAGLVWPMLITLAADRIGESCRFERQHYRL
jgi:hypothetical protein